MNTFRGYANKKILGVAVCLYLLGCNAIAMAAAPAADFEDVNEPATAAVEVLSPANLGIVAGIALVIAIIAVLGYHFGTNYAGSIRLLREKQERLEAKINGLHSSSDSPELGQLKQRMGQLEQENIALRQELKRLASSAEAVRATRPVAAASPAPVEQVRRNPAASDMAKVNGDGLTAADVTRLNEFLKTYQAAYAAAPATPRQKKQTKENFISQFALKGFSCCNGEAVTGAKAKPEFALVNDDPEVYAFQIKGSLYAVVPALWRSWVGLQVNLFGMKDLFNIRGADDSNYQIMATKAALCQVQGSKLNLMRAGQANLKEE